MGRQGFVRDLLVVYVFFVKSNPMISDRPISRIWRFKIGFGYFHYKDYVFLVQSMIPTQILSPNGMIYPNAPHFFGPRSCVFVLLYKLYRYVNLPEHIVNPWPMANPPRQISCKVGCSYNPTQPSVFPKSIFDAWVLV